MSVADWPNGMKFIQSDSQFKLTTDSVLLAAFAGINSRTHRVCEPCCGIGGVAILLAGRAARIALDCVELQAEAAALARENIALNGFSERINVIEGDLRDASLLPNDSYDVVVCNPPYFASGTGKPAQRDTINAARADENCTIDELCRMAARVLKTGGRLCVVFRAERMVDLLCAMRENGLEPKRLRRVVDKLGSTPRVILVEAARGAGAGIRHEADLVMREADGSYTTELLAIYGKERN